MFLYLEMEEEVIGISEIREVDKIMGKVANKSTNWESGN